MDRQEINNRICSMAAIIGPVFLFIGTYLHPMNADPNDAYAAFAEYALDTHWIASHLTQLLGIIIMVFSLIILTQLLTYGRPGSIWAHIGLASAISSLALAAALQAVDGIALRNMVNAWASASSRDKETIFQAAFAVRQIEIGLAGIASLLLGITVMIYGIALLDDQRFPKWIGIIAIAGGLPTLASGIVIAYTGFSPLSMAINMPSSFLLLIWMISLGVRLLRNPIR